MSDEKTAKAEVSCNERVMKLHEELNILDEIFDKIIHGGPSANPEGGDKAAPGPMQLLEDSLDSAIGKVQIANKRASEIAGRIGC